MITLSPFSQIKACHVIRKSHYLISLCHKAIASQIESHDNYPHGQCNNTCHLGTNHVTDHHMTFFFNKIFEKIKDDFLLVKIKIFYF